MASAFPTSESVASEPAKAAPNAADTQALDTPALDDSRSETTTVDTDADESAPPADLSSLTFFTRLYELPIVNDTVSSIYRIAEGNRYT
ncbi:hypothetical protein EV174_006212, partial [Coemansia sp. RSA 2320]